MKIIKYYLSITDSDGNKVQGSECTIPYSEKNITLAKAEAYGEITVEDDGQPEPESTPSAEDIALDLLADHEQRLCMLELGGETV